MNRHPEIESLILALESMTHNLKETASQIETASTDLKRPRWLRTLHDANRKLANTVLRTLPRITGQAQREWAKTARDRLKGQYGEWAKELKALRDQVKRHDQAK